MNKLFGFMFIGLFLMSFVVADAGAIWTTRENCVVPTVPQNENAYNIGENVWIRGDGFAPGEYDWEIEGQPGKASNDPNEIVASGTYIVDDSGYFCFDAYEVLNDDYGVYKANFNNKFDNYHVVPEFGFIMGMLTVLSAVGVFFVVRKD